MNKRPSNVCRIIAALLFAAFASGCATYDRIAEYPKHGLPATVTVTSKPLSKMSDLPVGAYYDSQRQIVISGHQKGMVMAGMLFGVVGVMVADSANKSSAENRFGNSARSTSMDLGTLSRELLEELIASQAAPGWTLQADKPQLELVPYAVFTVTKSGKARLHAMLKAEIPGSGGNLVWGVRYFARAPGEYNIEGDDGWMAGDRFAMGMRAAMKRVLQVCIDDCAGKLKGHRTVTAKGPLVYFNNDTIPWRFIVVSETDDDVVARFSAGDLMLGAGTHVLGRSDHEIAAATFSDPRK